jgi:SAM-dependent methyltransferase
MSQVRIVDDHYRVSPYASRWNTHSSWISLRAAACLYVTVVHVLASPAGGAAGAQDAPDAVPAKAYIPYAEAQSILESMPDSLPAALASKAPEALEDAWHEWIAQRDAEIRQRVARGDEDSIVNLWLYGTSFTSARPVRDADVGTVDRATLDDILERRLEDLVNGLASPGANERLQFARQHVETLGIDPTAAEGQARVRTLLRDARDRAIAEFQRLGAVVDATRRLDDGRPGVIMDTSLFSDRGLSTDTSILPNHAVDRALDALSSTGRLQADSVGRVAIVGPGLDFVNKANGYDFYPQQTIQPLAVIDTLVRLGLADGSDVLVTTFDLSPRVNHHLRTVRAQGRAGEDYVITLPLAGSQAWHAGLVDYWTRFGSSIGKPVAPVELPGGTVDVRVRAVRIPGARVASIVPLDLNVVVERLALEIDERFDLIVATNVFVYYDPFEQALALKNLGEMLRPGGLLFINSAVLPRPPLKPSAGYLRVFHSDREYDDLFWYERE